MTKTLDGGRIKVTRTTDKATVLSPDGGKIVTRNIWNGDNGRSYVQYEGRFHHVTKSEYYTQEYVMW